ncbi:MULTISPECIES: flagellar hook-length control protein FliK [unclassified Clostridium]|uniref:flagellar hook-length control protein FliK n=1 Tax=unclassified Clostridium TaxID=2614128 RepID=UPI0002984573|nr:MULTISPECIES: flagellar hook-length control protein FliK [unclassified Clostridium]EKQ51086.1 MAG: flagellar hook-length control protein [Clostridium sp. Maddingley MBC34-26]
MVTATKTSNDLVDLSYKSAKTDFTNKSVSDLYKKADTNRTTSKNEDFKEVLNSKTSSKNEDTEKVSDVNNNQPTSEETDAQKLDELKDKLEKMEKDSESGKTVSKDDLKEILSELYNLLVKLGNKDSNLKTDVKLNSESLEMMLKGITDQKSSISDLNSILENMSELLKNDSVKNSLDNDSLKLMEKLLNNLSSNLADDNSESTKGIKNNLKNLMSEISNILGNKQNENGGVFELKDMLNQSYSQSDNESSTESNDTEASKDNKVVSKEDKFLNSLLDDKKDDSLNKINLFASRSSAIQNQGVNTVRGLTINKATFVDDLIKDVKYMNTNSLKELTVKVNPGNLGEITIKLIQEDGLMKANLKANSKETTSLLSQNLTEIKKQLGEQNIKIADVNIELYHDDTTHFSGKDFAGNFAGEQNKQNNSSQSNVSNEQVTSSDSLAENLAKDNSNINMFA